MKDGFIKVGVSTPTIRVADVDYNKSNIIKIINRAIDEKVKLLALPELCLTGYTASDLFFHNALLDKCIMALGEIKEATRGSDIVVVVGLPYLFKDKLYNCAAIVQNDRVLALVPKTFLPNYSEFYEKRWFTKGFDDTYYVDLFGSRVVFSKNVIIRAKNVNSFSVAVEICEDLWAPISPSTYHALNGATVIVNLSASDELIGKEEYRRDLVRMHSGKICSAYLYADASSGESSTDMVFTSHNMICENGSILIESYLKENELLISEVDTQRIVNDRVKQNTFTSCHDSNYTEVEIEFNLEETELTRYISAHPFVPSSQSDIKKRCEKIITLQALGLKKRLEHTKAKTAVIGLSGGLDSTLALLVTVRAFDELKKDRKDILAVTMPCFGTTNRTRSNAESLALSLGVSFKEVNITESVKAHFKDIGQELDNYDVTYENGQARERTQVLMDLSNMMSGLVIGTGDLSELALGWATYNGDHMSMYGVNSSIPKTLVRYLVQYFANENFSNSREILLDILATPVSPELLPSNEDGSIKQRTEDLVGPYELHDFFLYYFVRHSFSYKKIKKLSLYSFKGVYTDKVIEKWLRVFVKRFFAQQFKRSCLPDGPKVGTITLSPRSDWRMPSDAMSTIFLE